LLSVHISGGRSIHITPGRGVPTKTPTNLSGVLFPRILTYNIIKFTIKDIQRIENWMNNYPQKIHGYRSAKEMAA